MLGEIDAILNNRKTPWDAEVGLESDNSEDNNEFEEESLPQSYNNSWNA